MNQIKILKKLDKLSYFDKNTLAQFTNLSDNSLYANIKRWLKQGYIIQLKKGLYVTKDFLSLTNQASYAEFITNKLKTPSYISLEYVLQKNSILSEAVYAFTSITSKSKRIYTNQLGSFIYRNIKPDLFTGYSCLKKDNFEIFEASKSKALFDYLYLKTYKTKHIDIDLFNSFRLNLNELSNKDLKEFARYCKILNKNKMYKIFNFIEKNYDK